VVRALRSRRPRIVGGKIVAARANDSPQGGASMFGGPRPQQQQQEQAREGRDQIYNTGIPHPPPPLALALAPLIVMCPPVAAGGGGGGGRN
jgi:hypothetical protein